MTATYRTAWMDPTDPMGNRVNISYHGADLNGAKIKARNSSKSTGSAYVIKTIDGVDVSQLTYTDGRMCPHGWNAG